MDLGMAAMVAKNKDCLGKRSLSRSDTSRVDRKQLVGLLSDDPSVVLAEGAQVLEVPVGAPMPAPPVPMAGHVTSSYFSPTLERSIAMALVRRGQHRMGERVQVVGSDGRVVTALIASSVFYDPKGERQNAC